MAPAPVKLRCSCPTLGQMASSAEPRCKASPSPRNYYAVMACSDSVAAGEARRAARRDSDSGDALVLTIGHQQAGERDTEAERPVAAVHASSAPGSDSSRRVLWAAPPNTCFSSWSRLRGSATVRPSSSADGCPTAGPTAHRTTASHTCSPGPTRSYPARGSVEAAPAMPEPKRVAALSRPVSRRRSLSSRWSRVSWWAVSSAGRRRSARRVRARTWAR